MLEDRIMGDKARYVYPDADCKNRKKCIFAQINAPIFAIFVALIVWLYNPAPSYAGNQFVCLTLVNNKNRISSIYAGSYLPGRNTFGGRLATLPLVRDYCRDSGTGAYYGYYYGGTSAVDVIATRAFSVSDEYDLSDYIQSWDMSQVANKLGCAGSVGKISFPGLNQVIALLPQSPAAMRIPTQITKMAGENTLAGNLAIELYSGVWQFLGILTSFKLFKVFFRG